MDHFDDSNNAGFYPTTVSGEFYGYPIETSAPGWVQVEIPAAFPYGWGMGGWPDYVADPQSSLRNEAGLVQPQHHPFMNHGPTHTSPSYGAQIQGYNHQLFPEHHQSAAGWDLQPLPSDIIFRENHLTNTMASGTPVVTPIPDNGRSLFLHDSRGIQS